MGKRTGDKYRTIIEAAVRVIAEHGYHNAQVSKIAREAGVADGTIYLYFQNKEDVLISLFRVKMGEFVEFIREKIEPIADPFARLAQLIYCHFSSLQADRKLALVMQIQLRQSDPSIRASISSIIRSYYNLIEDLVKHGINRGFFRADINPRTARKMIFGTMDEMATCWVLSTRQYDLRQLAPEAYSLIARALSIDGNYPPFPHETIDCEKR